MPKEKKIRQHPPLIPSRLTDDNVFQIISQNQRIERTLPLDTNNNNHNHHSVVKVIAHPTMRSGHDFDINTAWIELLIHEQQMKLSSQMETASAAV